MNPQTVTRQRPGTRTDSDGNTVDDWTSTTDITIDGCMLAPVLGDEYSDHGRQGVLIGWTLYRRLNADVRERDRIVTATDGTFEVEGRPASWSSPYSTFQGLQVALQRMEG